MINAIQQAFDKGAYEEVIAKSEQALQRNPDHVAVLHLMALAYFKQENFAKSLALMDQLIAAQPDEAEYYGDRGVTYFRTGQWQSAMQDFEKALLLEPERAYRYACRAYLKDKMGDLEGAVTDYQRAIALDPEDEIAKNNLEVVQQKQGYQLSKQFRYKSKAHFTPKEKEAYARQYAARHGTENPLDAPPAAPTQPSTKDLLREMGKVFTSAEGFRGFLRFVGAGFKIKQKS